MATSNVNISMPTSLRKWVTKRIAHGGYGNVSEYFRDLVRKDKELSLDPALEAELLQAARDPEEVPLTAQDWQHVRAAVRTTLRGERKAASDR
jgi:antitoxin ParD1/3/4